MFDSYKNEREMKKVVVSKLNDEIKKKACDPDSDAKEVFELWQSKQTVKMGGIPIGDVVKIAANVAIVSAIMIFETRYVLNKTATKFIKPLS